MKSGLRQGILSDEAVLFRCPDQQSIPFQKLNLAARSGAKLTRPAKAAYMFQNLKLPATQKESLIEDFILRSQKQRPITVPARVYATLSADKVNALVTQVASNTISHQIQAAIQSAVQAAMPPPPATPLVPPTPTAPLVPPTPATPLVPTSVYPYTSIFPMPPVVPAPVNSPAPPTRSLPRVAITDSKNIQNRETLKNHFQVATLKDAKLYFQLDSRMKASQVYEIMKNAYNDEISDDSRAAGDASVSNDNNDDEVLLLPV